MNDIAPTIYETLGVEAPDDLPRARAAPDLRACRCATRFDAPDAPTHQAVQYYEMMGHRAIYRRRLEGGDPPPARACRSTTTTGSSTTWPRTAPSATTWPRASPTSWPRWSSLWWARGRGARRAAARRPDHRAVLHPLPRPLAPPVEPALHLLPADVAAARPGRPGARGPGLGHGRHHRATGRAPAACSTPPEPRTPGSACSSRTTAWSSTTTASATTTWWSPTVRRPGRAVGGGRPVPPHGQERRRPPWSSTARRAATMDVPFAMTMISSVGPSIGYDHGSPVSERYAGHFPFEGTPRAARRDRGPPGARRTGTPRPRPRSGRPCPASRPGQPISR